MRIPPPPRTVGFMVWNPDGYPPRFVHGTFPDAVAEAERLKGANPGQRFYVMAPVMDMPAVGYALGFSRGREEAKAEAHREIMRAEALSDRLGDEAVSLRNQLRKLGDLAARHRDFQAIVADCLLWFDGFAAAHSPKDTWERPHLPSRDRLRELNAALQAVDPANPDADQEIPF